MENYQRQNSFQVTLINIFPILVCIVFSGCNSSNTVLPKAIKNKEIAALHDELIPENVQQYLSSSFSAFRIPRKTDYSKSWWSFYDKESIPYVVKTDINDDKLADYGFILNKPDSIYVIILTGRGNSFRHWISRIPLTNDAETLDIHFGLTIEPPGQIDIVYPQIKSLILKSNGISLMDYENRACVFYWADSAVNLFNTSNKQLSVYAK